VTSPEAELGDISRARSEVDKAVHWNPDTSSRGFAAITLTRVGDADRAEAFVKAADVRPLDTLHNVVVLAAARAAIQLDRKNPNQAIEELKAAFLTI
jgi:hypothetical protein